VSDRRADLELVAAELGVSPAGVKALMRLLRDPEPVVTPELIDTAEVARRFGRSRDWVYEHAADLGVVRLGDGARPRLAFDPARVSTYIDGKATIAEEPPPSPAPPAPRRPRRSASVGAPLLRIGPESE
jgi:hypothetical protein